MAYEAAPTEGGLQEVTELWWPWLVVSLVSAAVGVVALVYPDKTLEVLAILFGINLLILGIVQLGAGLAGGRGHRTAPARTSRPRHSAGSAGSGRDRPTTDTGTRGR